MEKFSIRVNIAERYYPLKIEREDEEKVRRAVKLINEKVLSYKQRHGDKDVQDWLAMVSMYFAMKVVENEQNQLLPKTISGLQDLDKKLSEYLDYVTEK
ncbi:MAG: cell division protein ZapA [Prevotellaceae bacterium]|jgi:cell division protein ZapA|nr:cell division protein ZapA [Prevotellaceae bacterium]